MVARAPALALFTLAFAGCTGNKGYSTEEVIEAFRQQEIPLAFGERREERDILAPPNPAFVVIVTTDDPLTTSGVPI